MQLIDVAGFVAFCRDQKGLGDHSLRAYQQDLRVFSNFLSEAGDSQQLSAELILRYQRYQRETKAASPATIRRRMVTLRAYCTWHERQDAAFSSPFNGLELDLRVPQRLPRPLDRPTLAAVFRSAPHLRSFDNVTERVSELDQSEVTGLMARLLVVTGLRIGELSHVQLRDVSAAGAQIRVMGKGSRERTVYVTNVRLLQDFGSYLNRRRLDDAPEAFVFLNTRGGRMTEAAFRKRLRRLSTELQIAPHITPHRFRHSAATMLIEEGVDIRLVQRLLGHASISTTEIYTKVSDNSLFQAIEHADTLAKVDS